MQRHPREGWKSRRLGRRDFLRASAGTAVAVPSLAAILAACSNPRNDAANSAEGFQVATPDNPVKLPVTTEPIADGLAAETGATLQIYNWDQYVWKRVVEEFCAANNCDYEITTFDNMEEAVEKMNTGQLTIDVFFPTYDVLGKLVKAGFMQPLNHSYIGNITNVWDMFQDPFYDQGWQYSVPYVVYSTGIGYRRDVISDDEIRGLDNPYDILYDPTYKGRVGVYNSYRDAIAESLLHLGNQDINTTDPAAITAAKDDLLSMIDSVNVRNSINGAYNKLPKGEYDVHQAWSGDIAAAWGYVNKYVESEYEKLGYWFPEDRVGPVDNDLMAIPASAEHPVLAHLFLDYLLDFKNAMDNFSWVGYQPPQNEADPDSLTKTEGRYSVISKWAAPTPYVGPWMSDAVVRQEDFDTGLRLHELDPATNQLWQDAWQEFKAGG